MPPRFPRLRASASRRILRGATVLALPLAAMATPVHAQAPAAAAIAPGPLGPALSAYAARAGVLLSFDPALTRTCARRD